MENQDLTSVIAPVLAHPPAFPEHRFAGRGIVICAGGPRYFTCAFVLLHVLRHAHNCGLPIQVWHLGQRELSPAMQALLRREGAELVDAEPLLSSYPATIRNGWALKPYAVTHSRFAEVFSLDADALPLVRPDQIFEWAEYQAHGALFWPDRVDLAAENPAWHALGLAPRREPSFETGQFVIDKRRCWEVLALTVELNNQSEQLYNMIYGEKDSFLLAFLLRQQRFGRIADLPLMFDSDLVQRDPRGDPFIHHRTFSKYLFAGHNRPVFGDTLTPAMEAALAVLRADWTGIVFHPPPMSPRVQAAADAIAGQRFMYETSGAGRHLLVLDPDFQVGLGRAEYEQHWAVVERGDAIALQLYSATRLAIELSPMKDGSWSGTAEASLGFSARLVPEAAAATLPFAGAARVSTPSTALVASLMAAVTPGSGFDAGRAAQLESALTLLNRTHDDVPEVLHGWVARENLMQSWSNMLQELASSLAQIRDARLQATTPLQGNYDLLRPGFYDRIP